MWTQFILTNLHFSLNVFGALAFFSIFCLYLDAWSVKKNFKDLLKVIGFLLLSISFLVSATNIGSSLLIIPLLKVGVSSVMSSVLRILGYAFEIVGLLADSVEPHPQGSKHKVFLPTLGYGYYFGLFFQPILAGIVGFLYLRRATVGLETHLKKVSFAFFVLAIAEVMSLADLFAESSNVQIHNLVAQFGVLWMAREATYALVFLIFASWGFYYLFKRIQTQLFITITTAILAVFLLTTVSFTALLMKNIQDETLGSLEASAKVLLLNLESKKSEAVSDAQLLAQDPNVIQTVASGDKKTLRGISERFLLTKKESTLVITNSHGVVLARAEDWERTGDSLSDDPLVKRALNGIETSSVITKDGVLAPEVHIRSAAVIKRGGRVIGTVLTGTLIDNAYLDGIKKETGFEASVYGGDSLSATSITITGSDARPLGIKETLKKDEFFGPVTFLSVPYLASYIPLKDVDENTIGMLFVGIPQIGVLKTAERSIELTFVVSVMLLILSVIPAYFVSRYISRQVH